LARTWLSIRVDLVEGHGEPYWPRPGRIFAVAKITEDYQRAKLSRLRAGGQFVYVFDLGDDWAHLCSVGAQRIDPVEPLGILPGKPLPYRGWATLPTSTAASGTATTPRPSAGLSLAAAGQVGEVGEDSPRRT
jgi:hypothetical protein